ncbi:MAG: hypothetical protein Ct9H300mP27_01260 [Chloroflexota bacterium]|nr:MAG: hypothetical protein Ct9H300mP27_01260 [Chloroflexota bacterium]
MGCCQPNAKICASYGEKGRSKAQVFVTQGLPGTPDMVYAEWTQEAIEPNWPSGSPRRANLEPRDVPYAGRALESRIL